MSRCVCGAGLAHDRDMLCPTCQHEFDGDSFNPEEEDGVALPDLYTDDETVAAAQHYVALALLQRTRPDVLDVLTGPPQLPDCFWPDGVEWTPGATPKDNIRKARHLLDVALAEGEMVLDDGYPSQTEVSEWCKQFRSPLSIQSLQLVEEVGELWLAVSGLARGVVKREQRIRGTHEEWSAKIREELGDVFISLLNTADIAGYDLATVATLRWLDKVSKRDFIADPIGHGMPEDDVA